LFDIRQAVVEEREDRRADLFAETITRTQVLVNPHLHWRRSLLLERSIPSPARLLGSWLGPVYGRGPGDGYIPTQLSPATSIDVSVAPSERAPV